MRRAFPEGEQKKRPVRLSGKTALRAVLCWLFLFMLIHPSIVSAKCITGYQVPEDDPHVRLIADGNRLPAGKLKTIKGKTCYVKKKGGKLKSQWIRVKGNVYYLDKKGNAVTGRRTCKGFNYYFDTKGRLVYNRLVSIRGRKYFCTATGAMVKNGWKKIKGYWYYFKADCSMAVNRKVGSWYVGKDGRLNMDKKKKKVRTKTFKSTKKKRLIIVGASRVLQMSRAVTNDEGVIYIAANGKGIKWLEKRAVKKLRKFLKKYPKSQVVLQLGNNDIKRRFTEEEVLQVADSYIDIYKKLFSEYRSAKFYVMDALPSASTQMGEEKNEKRQIFNAALKKAFPTRYMGGYNYLVNTGFICSYNDNHYSDNTSRKIYNYILGKVKK